MLMLEGFFWGGIALSLQTFPRLHSFMFNILNEQSVEWNNGLLGEDTS